MKTITMLLFCASLLATSCKKDDDQPDNPIDALPPATQVGAQTFGCLVDGEVFLPKDIGQGRLTGYIQNIDGNFFMAISSANSNNVDIGLFGFEIVSIEEKQYTLGFDELGLFHAIYSAGDANNFLRLITNKNNPGILTITKYDPENFILSGAFEFTVTDERGTEIKVTDGRFDVKYTN